MKRSFISVFAIAFVAVVGYQFLGSKDAPAETLLQIASSDVETAEAGPSFLFCSEEDAGRAVLSAFEEDGDEMTIQTAKVQAEEGRCSFVDNYHFRRSDIYGPSPEGDDQFDMVGCETLANGYCIALQPAYRRPDDNSVVPGFVLLNHTEPLPEIRMDSAEVILISNLH